MGREKQEARRREKKHAGGSRSARPLEKSHWALLGGKGWGKYADGTPGLAPGRVLAEGRILIIWHEALVCAAAESRPAHSPVV
jgi:hypothetical protein